MSKKESVNQDTVGYAMMFGNGREFVSSKVLKIYCQEKRPTAIDVMHMIKIVFDNLECGVDVPGKIEDLYCHVFNALEVDGDLKITGEPLSTYGGWISNVI